MEHATFGWNVKPNYSSEHAVLSLVYAPPPPPLNKHSLHLLSPAQTMWGQGDYGVPRIFNQLYICLHFCFQSISWKPRGGGGIFSYFKHTSPRGCLLGFMTLNLFFTLLSQSSFIYFNIIDNLQTLPDS